MHEDVIDVMVEAPWADGFKYEWTATRVGLRREDPAMVTGKHPVHRDLAPDYDVASGGDL